MYVKGLVSVSQTHPILVKDRTLWSREVLFGREPGSDQLRSLLDPRTFGAIVVADKDLPVNAFDLKGPVESLDAPMLVKPRFQAVVRRLLGGEVGVVAGCEGNWAAISVPTPCSSRSSGAAA